MADIGAGKKVSFKTDSQYLTAKTEAAGTDAANVSYGLKTKALTAADGKVSAVDTAEDGLATAKNVAETINQTYWTAASGKSGSGSQTDETANDADKRISAGDTVTFNAGNNLDGQHNVQLPRQTDSHLHGGIFVRRRGIGVKIVAALLAEILQLKQLRQQDNL